MKSLVPIGSSYLKDTGAIVASEDIYSGVLAAGVEQTLTVPAGADFAMFNADGDIYVNYDTTAAVPTGSLAKAGGELNPETRYVGDVTVLHVIAAVECKLNINFYGK
jgi:hypothetical protein